MANYQVIVGNVGTVHDGTNKGEAKQVYEEYVKLSEHGYGRVAYESVLLMEDEEPIEEYVGARDQ